MARKNALGRGLGALIDEEDKELLIGKISGGTEIFIDRIELNPFQPRSKIDEESLNELASSIKELGIVVPITVREIEDNKYQLITGERRLRAAKIAGIKKIPAFVRIANDQNMLEMALVENIQREDLNAIDVAISYQRLTEECNLTQEDLSQRVGKKRATVTNYLRLLKLPPEIQLGLKDNKISMGHARALINIEDTNDQLRLYYKIVDEDLSVRKV
jgi:ParB family chromosome partitioning protein